MKLKSDLQIRMSFQGIYCIKNTVNGKRYIGSTKNLYIRYKHHMSDLRNGTHINKYLQNSFNKYGESAFIFEIICDCDEEDTLIYEQFFIDTLNPEYNICRIAGTTRSVEFSSEHRYKLSIARLGKANSQGKKYIGKTLISPDGVLFTINTCLNSFCLEHSLDVSDISKMLRGKKPHSKRWKLCQ